LRAAHDIPKELEYLQWFRDEKESILCDNPDLAGQSFAYLASGKAKILSGKFVKQVS